MKIRIVILSTIILFFCLLTYFVKSGGIEAFENSVYTAIAQYINPTLTNIMTAITHLGSSVAVIIIVAALLILPFTLVNFGIPVALNAVCSGALSGILKILIARDRPSVLRLVSATGYGFPSGHSMNNAALYAIIILLVFNKQKIKIFACLF